MQNIIEKETINLIKEHFGYLLGEKENKEIEIKKLFKD